MNRKERRRIQQGKANMQDIQTIADHSKMSGIETATQAIFSSMIINLHDEFGWGHVRLQRLLDKINEDFKKIGSGEINVDTLRARILEELGIRIG